MKEFKPQICIHCYCITCFLLCIIILLLLNFSNRLGILLAGFCFIGSFAFFAEVMFLVSVCKNNLLQEDWFIGNINSWKHLIDSCRDTKILYIYTFFALSSGIILYVESISYFFFLLIFWVISYIVSSMLYHKIKEKILLSENSFRFIKKIFFSFITYSIICLLLLIYFIIIKRKGDLLANEIILLGGGMFGSQALLLYILRGNFKREK